MADAQEPQYPRLSSRRHAPSSGTRSAEAAKRKRERDRDCQRRKREREKENTQKLEERIRDLQAQLDESRLQRQLAEEGAVVTPSTYHSVATPSEAAWEGNRRLRSESSVQRPVSPLSTRGGTETVTVSLDVLEACFAAPVWARLPLHGLSLVPNPMHCVRGNGLQLFIDLMRADPAREKLCPPKPKVIDILYGGSKNPLANLIVNECSKEALLAPEKLAVNFALYKYCRVSFSLKTLFIVHCAITDTDAVAHLALSRNIRLPPQIHESHRHATHRRAPMVHRPGRLA